MKKLIIFGMFMVLIGIFFPIGVNPLMEDVIKLKPYIENNTITNYKNMEINKTSTKIKVNNKITKDKVLDISSTSEMEFITDTKWIHREAGTITHTCFNKCIVNGWKVYDSITHEGVDYTPYNLEGVIVKDLVVIEQVNFNTVIITHGDNYDPEFFTFDNDLIFYMDFGESNIDEQTYYGGINGSVGKLNGSLEFDGTSYIKIGSRTDFNTVCNNGCTFSAWIKRNDNNTDLQVIVGKYGGTDTLYFLFSIYDNNVSFTIRKNGVDNLWANTQSATKIEKDIWYYITGVYNGSNTFEGNTKIYVNGALESISDNTTMINSSEWQRYEDTYIGTVMLGDNFTIVQKETFYTEGILYNMTNEVNSSHITVVDNRTVLNMRFDINNSVTTYDDTSYNNNGNITNAKWTSSGKYGGAYEFDGDGDYIRIEDNDKLNPQDTITQALWVKFNSHPSDGSNVELLSKDNGDPNRQYIITYSNYGGNTRFVSWLWNTTGTGHSAYYNFEPVDGIWYHIAQTYNGTVQKLYFNGVNVRSKIWTSTLKNISYPLYIGSSKGTSCFFNGSIDDVTIWNYALNATEVTNNYFRNLNKYFSQAEYKMKTIGISKGTKYVQGNLIGTNQLLGTNIQEYTNEWKLSNGYNVKNEEGLVSFLPLDNNSIYGENNLRVHDYASNNNYTVTNALPTNEGYYDGGYSFDGHDDYITMGGPTEFSTLCNNGCTVCVWAKHLTDAGHQPYVSRYDGGANRRYFELRYIANLWGFVLFEGQHSTPNIQVTISVTEQELLEWNHVCATYDGSSYYHGYARMYTNGKLRATSLGTLQVDSGKWANSQITYLGRSAGDSSICMNGTIDEVRLYNRTLSSDEIKDQYASGINKYNKTTLVDLNEPHHVNNESTVVQFVYVANSNENNSYTPDIVFNTKNVSYTSYNAYNNNDLLDEVLITSRNLSSNEISNLYQLGNPTQKANEIITDNISYYNSMDTFYDWSGNNNFGQEIGQVNLINTTFDSNRSSNALFFNGESYVDITNIVPEYTSSTGTVAMWVKLSNVTEQQIFWSFGNETGNTRMELKLYSKQLLAALISEGSKRWGVYIPTNLNKNTWYHIAVVQNGTEPVLYLNGIAEAQLFWLTADKTEWWDTLEANESYLGMRSYNNNGHATFLQNGNLDDVRIYNRNLSSTEIYKLYGKSLKIINSTYSMTDGHNICTTWQIDQSILCNTTDGRPIISFNTTMYTQCSLKNVLHNYDVNFKCETTGTTSHVCTLNKILSLNYGVSSLYIGCSNVEDSVQSGALAINMTAGTKGTGESLISCIKVLEGTATIKTIDGQRCAVITR